MTVFKEFTKKISHYVDDSSFAFYLKSLAFPNAIISVLLCSMQSLSVQLLRVIDDSKFHLILYIISVFDMYMFHLIHVIWLK